MSEPHSLIRPRLLVSVCDAEEAEIACSGGADVVDAKDPARGALGALPFDAVRAIVRQVAGRAATSAVTDEDESDSCTFGEAGSDYVKVALRPGMASAELSRLAAAAPDRVIGVLFAEEPLPADIAARLACAGLRGAMIDTRGKDGRRLTDLLPHERLAAFVASCRCRNLLCGLAGSLRIADIAALAVHAPDYLGFRGGLCRDGDRRGPIDPQRVAEAARAIRGLGRRDAA